jgi:hypothetical protein
MNTPPNDKSPLREMKEFADSINPLNGKNVARYVAANFRDNGDGTMTFRRVEPYVNLDRKTSHG